MKLTEKDKKEAKQKVKTLEKQQERFNVDTTKTTIKLLIILSILLFAGIMIRYFIKNTYLDIFFIMSSVIILIIGIEYSYKQQVKEDLFIDMINQISETNKYKKFKLSLWRVFEYKFMGLLYSIFVVGVLFGLMYVVKIFLLFIIRNIEWIIVIVFIAGIIFFIVRFIVVANKKVGNRVIEEILNNKEIKEQIKTKRNKK